MTQGPRRRAFRNARAWPSSVFVAAPGTAEDAQSSSSTHGGWVLYLVQIGWICYLPWWNPRTPGPIPFPGPIPELERIEVIGKYPLISRKGGRKGASFNWGSRLYFQLRFGWRAFVLSRSWREGRLRQTFSKVVPATRSPRTAGSGHRLETT